MADSFRAYRNRKTGLVGHYDPRLAREFPELIEVADDAKPLAYTRIPAEAVEAVLEAHSTESNDDKAFDDAPDSGSVEFPTPASIPSRKTRRKKGE